MARLTGTAGKPNEDFVDVPIHLRAHDEDAFKAALEKAAQGDLSEIEARVAFTPMEVHERATLEDYRSLDLAQHRKSVGVVADVALSHVGESLREARQRVGYTQAEVAEAIGACEDTVSRIERGSRKPSLDMLIKLCWLYNVSVDRVLGMITPAEDHLLEVYRDTIEEAKPKIVKLAEACQSGELGIGDELDGYVQQFLDGLRERTEELIQQLDLDEELIQRPAADR